MRVFVATLVCMMLPLATSSRVQAQDLDWLTKKLSELTGHQEEDSGSVIKRLSELTERKGYKDAPLRDWICEAFDWGMSECRGQLTFQAPYRELNGRLHAVNTVRIKDKPPRIVFVVHDKRAGYAFWTDPDGTLRGCLRSKLANQWGEWEGAKSSCEEAETKTQFSDEIKYWRTKRAELEKLPDRRE